MFLAQSFVAYNWKFNLTGLVVELFRFMLLVPSKAMNLRDIALLHFEPDTTRLKAKICCIDPETVACKIKLEYSCCFISMLRSCIVNN